MGMIGSALGALRGLTSPSTDASGVYSPSPLDTGIQMLLGSGSPADAAQHLRELHYQNTVMRPMQMRIMQDFLTAAEQGQGGQGGAGGGAGGGAPGGGMAITPQLAMLGTLAGYNMTPAVDAAKLGETFVGPNNEVMGRYDPRNIGRHLVTVGPGQLSVENADGQGNEGVMNAPGAVAATAQSKLADSLGTGIGQAATSIETPNVDGVPTPMTRLSMIEQTGGSDALSRILGGLGLPQVGNSATGAPAGAAAPGVAGTPAAAAPGPAQPPVRPVQRGQRPAPAGNGLRGVSADTQAARTQMATDAATRYKNILDAGAQAPGAISRLHLLGNLLGNYEGGALGPTGYEIASGLNSLGIKVDPHLANKDAAQMLQRTMAAEAMKNPDTGSNMFPKVTNFEYENALKQVPGMLQSAAGRKILLQMKEAEQNRISQTSAFARKWVQRYGRFDATDSAGMSFQDHLEQWAAKHPLYAGIKMPGQR